MTQPWATAAVHPPVQEELGRRLEELHLVAPGAADTGMRSDGREQRLLSGHGDVDEVGRGSWRRRVDDTSRS